MSLGFKEVSGPIIEPAFWVFDSLFMPQDHPAREIQDAFYLSNPEAIKLKKDATLERVREAHLNSWGSDWTIEMAEKATLRTHTTNVSARQVDEFIRGAAPGGKGQKLPLKLFSVGRVFRNENIDYKHLTDFYHTDGIIIGNNLTMANLFEVLISVYGQFGMELRFKPAYFPFVEPGVEIYAYYERTKEWVEMGGAGILRREVTGVPRKNMTVLAWGLGVERLTLLRDPGIKSIVELYNNGTGWLRDRRMI
jgi:phenylalanyl-tRNA synthetase alpha chain